MIERILLVDVEFDRRAETQGQLQTRWTHHPLGLMSLAANARRRLPHLDFRILHSVTCANLEDSLTRTLDDFRPDIVGLRALSLFQQAFAEAARVVRGAGNGVPLIGGGPYASASHGRVLSEDMADLVVFEEGETTFSNRDARGSPRDHPLRAGARPRGAARLEHRAGVSGHAGLCRATGE
jgi:anaerobic magnesium-protoporphyrin IX monomethyl ester cyclase